MFLVVLRHTGAAWRLGVLTAAPLIQRAAARAAQEYFVEDLLEVLMHITQHTPAVLEGARMEEVLMFLVVFLNSPQHVRNPYLRGKMVEVRVVPGDQSCHSMPCLIGPDRSRPAPVL